MKNFINRILKKNFRQMAFMNLFHNRVTTSRKKESRMRGVMQMTNETILFDVEASDTNDDVKAKI